MQNATLAPATATLTARIAVLANAAAYVAEYGATPEQEEAIERAEGIVLDQLLAEHNATAIEISPDNPMPHGAPCWSAKVNGQLTFVFAAGQTAAERLAVARRMLAARAKQFRNAEAGE